MNEYFEEEITEPVISTEIPYQKANTTNLQPSVRKNIRTKKSIIKKTKSKTIEGFSLRKAVG